MKTCKTMSRALAVFIAVMLMTVAILQAHEVTYRGTVVAIESTKLQVKTIDEKTKKEESLWFNVGKGTKTWRGDHLVPYAQAKITNGERIVLIVDHDAEARMLATEIRLAVK
jgi:hypothetical protein